MSIEENKELLRRWIDPPGGWESLNRQIHGAEDPEAKLDEFYRNAREELFAPDFVRHHTKGDMDLDGYLRYDRALWSAIPDLNISIKEIVGEGDWVMARITLRGTHRGDLHGIPATGKKIEIGGMMACRFAGGKFAEVWTFSDELGLMQQLGVIPSK
jgi:steroid delta-isomerase-like uncharacterized protein